MLSLPSALDAREAYRAILGRYATGPEVTEHSMVIHDIVNDETRSPVHLCVDTSLTNNRMAIKAMIRYK